MADPDDARRADELKELAVELRRHASSTELG
jgi:hypothetical protein